MARDQREEAVTAPVREQLYCWRSQHQNLREAFRKLERAMGTKLDEGIMAARSMDAFRMISKAIFDAARKSRQPPTSLLVEIDAPFMRRDTLEAFALDKYREQAIPDLSLSLAPIDFSSKTATAMNLRRIRVELPAISFNYDAPEISSHDRSMAGPAQPVAR